MSIERSITVFAAIAVSLIVILYTFGLQNKLLSFASQSEVIVATGSVQPSEVKVKQVEIADLQALASYQATLPLYWVEGPSGTGKVVEQIANLQELAEFHATSSFNSAGADSMVQQRHQVVEQIANLHELAEYQATLPIYWIDSMAE